MNKAEYKVGLSKEQDVLVDFGQPMRFVVLDPEDALHLAAYLIKHALASTKKPKIQ